MGAARSGVEPNCLSIGLPGGAGVKRRPMSQGMFFCPWPKIFQSLSDKKEQASLRSWQATITRNRVRARHCSEKASESPSQERAMATFVV